jgi:pyridoxine 5-phosphate synthase
LHSETNYKPNYFYYKYNEKMARLSVNINKVATIRNARGGNIPNVVQVAIDCQRFGAEGITVHPRPDERHITRKDVFDLRPVVNTEFNIEGYPSKEFIAMVVKVKPEQVTLVPDPPEALTSNAGWDTIKNESFLKEVTAEFKNAGIRTSIFIDTDLKNIANAAKTGTDRVELYTEPYADMYPKNKEKAVHPFAEAAKVAMENGLGLNAGHDLSLENLKYFNQCVKGLNEVSIGHALISDALYFGLENTIQMYLRLLE